MHIGHEKKLIAIGLTLVLALIGGGVAMAWFTSGGSGTGSAVVGSPGPSDFHIIGHVPDGVLLPGDDPQPFVFDVHNTGTGSEHVGTVDIAVAAAPGTGYALEDGTPITGCQASWFSVTGSVAVDTTLAAGAWDDGITGASISMTESSSDQSACQGHTVDVAFTVGLA
jgi:hypothetical protein